MDSFVEAAAIVRNALIGIGNLASIDTNYPKQGIKSGKSSAASVLNNLTYRKKVIPFTLVPLQVTN